MPNDQVLLQFRRCGIFCFRIVLVAEERKEVPFVKLSSGQTCDMQSK